jgi:hypothetical protein
LKQSFIKFQNLRKIKVPNVVGNWGGGGNRYYFDELGNIFFDKEILNFNKFTYCEYNNFNSSVAELFLKKINVRNLSECI